MGICPSRCGEKQPSPEPEPAATDAVLETRLSPSPYDPNHSLKRFLHLNQDPQTSATSKRSTSLVKSTPIPHSSELFSLPGSELEHRSSFALSPTGTPKRRAPRDVALMSSHFTLKSPSKGRSNNKRIRPATRGEHVHSAAHQRLVDAIARLERLNDAGKASVLGFRSSEDVAPKSSLGESPNKPAMRSRHVRHYHLPLPKSTMATAQFSHPPVDNPVSLDTTPAVTDFLRETFVSLIEKPRKLEHPKATAPATVTNRCRFEEIDGEEMFSFEFGPSEDREKLKQLPVRKKSVSLQRLLQSGTEGSSDRRFADDEVAMATVELEKKSSCSTWQPVEVLVEQTGINDRAAKARVSEESGMKSLREEGVVAPRPAQDRNVVTMRKAKSPRLTLRLKALKGSRRGRLSQSLDSNESSISHVDLEIVRNQGATPIAATRLSTVASPNKHASEVAAISIDAKRVELELLPVSSRLEPPQCEQKLELKANCCTGISDTSTTAGLAPAEILPPQEIVSLVEDPIPSTESAESSPREPAGYLDKVYETKEMRCEETLPSERTEWTGSEPPPIVSKVVLHSNSGGSQWFGLVETFRSLLRLLFFFMTEQVGAGCKIASKLTATAEPVGGTINMLQHPMWVSRLALGGAALLVLGVTTYDIHRSIEANQTPPTEEQIAALTAQIEESRQSGESHKNLA